MRGRLSSEQEQKLMSLAAAVVDQQAARIIVPAYAARQGFWFGGGNVVQTPQGDWYLTGRYRNAGDSRTGVAAGERGLELALFRSRDRGHTFEKVVAFNKSDLNVGDRQVLSIEGSALRIGRDSVELFVSSEKKNIDYPPPLQAHLKPGTGVWTIDRLQAGSFETLRDAKPRTWIESRDPEYLHCKDPSVFQPAGGTAMLLFCTHPFSWSSSNSAYLPLTTSAGTGLPRMDFFPRGTTWDVAITRATCLVDVPRVGAFCDQQVSLLFYDGGESLRNLDEHAQAVRRPRGYSCEELGGLAYIVDHNLDQPYRLSRHLPLFVSPHGTGSSRYVNVLSTEQGWYATWQQSQPDGSQPLVAHGLGADAIRSLLS